MPTYVFRRILVFIICCSSMVSIQGQKKIFKVEYFFDTDPGFNNGSQLLLPTPVQDVNNLNITPNISSLSTGLHTLFVRVLDSNYRWSQSIPQLFYKEVNLASTAPNLSKLEYFIDTDPGFGLGNDVPIGTGTQLNALTFAPSLTGLTTGLHNLFVRTKDANGKWSQSIPQLFYKEVNLASTAPNLSKLEYFIDTDPGFGLGTDVPIATGTNLNAMTFAPSLTGLSTGLHNLFVRTKDVNGKWSQSIPQLFYKEVNLATTAPNLSKLEYFIDTDPGFGLGTNVPIATGTDLNAIAFAPSLTGLSTGLHNLFVRTKDANGKWSQSIPQLFYKEVNLASTAPNLSKLEYFIDTDPGFGLGTDVPIATGTNLNAMTFAPSLTGLSTGLHNLFVRTKDVNGKWSQSIPQLFYKEVNLATTAPNLSKLEYFIDTDPGFGLGTNVPIATGTDLNAIAFAPSLTGLSTGLHNLFVRTKDANGKWSQSIPQLFYKEVNLASTAPNLSKLEYFIDTDPGFGLGADVPIATGTDLNAIAFAPSLMGLSTGLHNLFVRTKDANGKWSQSIPQLFYNEADLFVAAKNLTKLEYFIDKDPGFGSAINVPVVPNTSLTSVNFVPTISQLNIGLHWLGVRAKEQDGKWSQATHQLFYYEPVRGPYRPRIVRAEYYFDNFAPVGSGIPVVIAPKDTVSGLQFPVNVTGLAPGNHRFFLRTLSDSGRWSLTAYKDLTVISTAAGPSILVNSFTPNTICAGNTIDVAFHSTGNYVPGNIFTLQMSDASGLFGSPVNLGTTNSTVSSIINAVVPPNTAPNSYKLRVISSNVAVNGSTSDSSLAVLGTSQSFVDSTIYLNCFNDTYNLTNLYNVTNGGVWNTVSPTVAIPGMYKYYVTAGGGCSDTADITLKLEVATWTGTVNNDWHVPGNWNITKVPTAFTHVIIPVATPNPCIISTMDGVAASVQVRGSGNFQILNNRKLVINGVCTVLPPN